MRFTQTNTSATVGELQIPFDDDGNQDIDVNDGLQQYSASSMRLLTDQSENVVLERKVRLSCVFCYLVAKTHFSLKICRL